MLIYLLGMNGLTVYALFQVDTGADEGHQARRILTNRIYRVSRSENLVHSFSHKNA